MQSDEPSLLSVLAETRPPDRSGATSANRFQFQLSWAICRILELHRDSAEYAIILDFHDDVVEIDHETVPSHADFHQIKSKKDGNWTIGQLTRRSKQKGALKPSILGKLCGHRTTFGDKVRNTVFVSNRPLRVALTANKKADEVAEFSLSDAEAVLQDTVCMAIKAECGFDLDEDSKNRLRFVRTQLTPDDHVNQSRGRLAEFLESQIDPNAPVNPVYKILRSELERRNNDERLPVSADDLTKQRMFGRTQMTQILSLAKPRERISDALDTIGGNLATEGMPFVRRQRLRTCCNQIFADRLDASNTLLSQVAGCIRLLYRSWVSCAESTTGGLLNGLGFVRDNIDSTMHSDFMNAYSEDHFDALYLVISHEFTEFPTSGTEPSEETP